MTARPGGIGVVLLVLGACSAGTPVPEDRFYELNPEPPAVSSEVTLEGGLSIAHIDADPLRSGRPILFRDARRPLELGRYHYEFWAAPPPRMIQDALLDALRQSGVIDHVESESRRPQLRYELNVKVRHFEALVDTGRTRADLELEAVLRRRGSGDLIWVNVYRQQVAAKQGDMHALADAMQQGLAEIFEQITGDLKAAGTNAD